MSVSASASSLAFAAKLLRSDHGFSVAVNRASTLDPSFVSFTTKAAPNITRRFSVAVKERPIIGVWKRPIVTIAPSKWAERTTLLNTKLHHRTIRERSGSLARVVIVRIGQLAVRISE